MADLSTCSVPVQVEEGDNEGGQWLEKCRFSRAFKVNSGSSRVQHGINDIGQSGSASQKLPPRSR